MTSQRFTMQDLENKAIRSLKIIDEKKSGIKSKRKKYGNTPKVYNGIKIELK